MSLKTNSEYIKTLTIFSRCHLSVKRGLPPAYGKTGLPSIEDAIDSYTINAAQSLGIDDFTGSIEIGKAADFVVLSQDISHSSIQDITQTEVWMTLVNGRIVFDINQQY
ncbi:amidohydrolase family protein [Vibrio pectenicida]|uniref:amidohydrolase family protein n=1 Tax=Vibrio pectenicida TaxID=62763 RepID=UPI003B9C3FDD